MKKPKFIVVKNPETHKDIYINPEYVTGIVTGVKKIDQNGRPIIDGSTDLWSIFLGTGLNIIVTASDGRFILEKINPDIQKKPILPVKLNPEFD